MDIPEKERAILQELLRQIRQSAGLRQQDLAAHIGEPQSFVSKYESGERRLDVLHLRQIRATADGRNACRKDLQRSEVKAQSTVFPAYEQAKGREGRACVSDRHRQHAHRSELSRAAL